MLLILILFIILLLLISLAVGAVSIGGATFIVLFSDVIVCAIFIGFLIYKLIKRCH